MDAFDTHHPPQQEGLEGVITRHLQRGLEPLFGHIGVVPVLVFVLEVEVLHHQALVDERLADIEDWRAGIRCFQRRPGVPCPRVVP